MAQSKSKPTFQETSWFFIRFFYWFINKAQAIYTWVFPDDLSFPDNESGNLMRRMLAEQSPFDTISSSWVKLSFGYKFLAITLMVLTGGLIGIALSASVICALSALFIGVSAHLLFVAHEHHRRKVAKTMAEEATMLNKDLESQQEFFDEAIKMGHKVTEEFKAQVNQLAENAELINKEIEVVHEANQKLLVVEAVVEASAQSIEANDNVVKALDDTATQVNEVSKKLDQVTEHLDGFAALGDALTETKASQSEFSEAVGRFGLFVDSLTEKKDKVDVTATFDDWEAQMDARDKEFEDNFREFEERLGILTPGM